MKIEADKIVTGVLTAGVLALASWVWSVQTTLTQVRQTIHAEQKQDATLTMFWRLHSWERDRIHELESKTGKEPTPWPDLGD